MLHHDHSVHAVYWPTSNRRLGSSIKDVRPETDFFEVPPPPPSVYGRPDHIARSLNAKYFRFRPSPKYVAFADILFMSNPPPRLSVVVHIGWPHPLTNRLWWMTPSLSVYCCALLPSILNYLVRFSGLRIQTLVYALWVIVQCHADT